MGWVDGVWERLVREAFVAGFATIELAGTGFGLTGAGADGGAAAMRARGVGAFEIVDTGEE